VNKELKILGIVAAFTLLLYWGVEPFAHSQMHKHVEGNGLVYDGKADIEEASKDKKEAKEKFWADVAKIAQLKGDATAGEATYAMCAGCHMEGATNMGGVTPPSLDHAGAIYDKNFLIALIKDPAMATNVDHKYKDTSTHPMAGVMSMVSSDQDIANVVAYLKAKKSW
jgi:ubiquinol-cytochrome c reductase cytochrome c1 subunit